MLYIYIFLFLRTQFRDSLKKEAHGGFKPQGSNPKETMVLAVQDQDRDKSRLAFQET